VLTVTQLRAIFPHLPEVDVEKYLPLLLSAMSQYQIATPARVAAFVAQVGHESGEFRYFVEFASGVAYEGRADLGNTHPGDGQRYKGRGAIQITGRHNYEQMSRWLGVDFTTHPELLATPKFAILSAACWWQHHGLNELADAGEFTQITRRINGGTNGAKQREAYHAKALAVLAGNP
jgi:predicted chitinase